MQLPSTCFSVVAAIAALSASLAAGCAADTTELGEDAAEAADALRLAPSLAIRNRDIAACSDLRVRYHGVPAASSARGHWITISEVGTADDVQSYRFKYLPPASPIGEIALSTRGLNLFSSYEVRLYLDWEATRSFTVVARQPFNINSTFDCYAPLFAAVDSETRAGRAIQFSATDLKVTTSNWVALARPSQTAPNFIRFVKLAASENVDGALDTTGLAPGTYELRLFEDWDGTKEYYVYDRATVVVR